MRYWPVLIALGLAACEPSIPDSTAGVGFTDYNLFEQQQREIARLQQEQQLALVNDPDRQALASETIGNVDPDIGTPPAVVAAVPAVPSASEPAAAAPVASDTPQVAAAPLSAIVIQDTPQPAASAEDIAAAALDAAEAGETPQEASSINNPGISDEQNFDAVAGRESIESDAERLARNAENYEVIQPGALPERSGDGGPNIVAYALATTNNPGQVLYERNTFNAVNRFNRSCSRYRNADEAQRDFLSKGGPDRDRMGVDPDGDGFACFWDPRPFRVARGG